MSLKTSALVAAALLLAACGGGVTAGGASCEPTATDASSSAAATVCPAPIETTPPPPPTWPLTGEMADHDASLDPVAVVKVENDPSVRPQTGLDSADIVVEEMVEGGLTRFAAIYQSNFPAEIGPVRSVRHVDAAIAEPIADIFVFSGGARRTMNFLFRKLPSTITIVREGGPGMYRSSKHAPPHNVFLKTDKLLSSWAQNGTQTSGLFAARTTALVQRPVAPVVSETPAPKPSPVKLTNSGSYSALPAEEVRVHISNFSEPRWTWDGSTWGRSEHSTPFVTPAGDQITVPTVVVLFVQTMDAGYKDPAGSYVPRSVLTSGGTGFLLSNGAVVPLHWTKPKLADQFNVSNTDGTPLAIPVGKLWLELVPRDEGYLQVRSN